MVDRSRQPQSSSSYHSPPHSTTSHHNRVISLAGCGSQGQTCAQCALIPIYLPSFIMSAPTVYDMLAAAVGRMRRAGWNDAQMSFGKCEAMPAWLTGLVHWQPAHRRYCWERVLSASASRTELNESSALIIPYLVDLLSLAHTHPNTQLPRQEQHSLSASSEPVLDVIACLDLLICLAKGSPNPNNAYRAYKVPDGVNPEERVASALISAMPTLLRYVDHPDHIVVCMTLHLLGCIQHLQVDTLLPTLLPLVQPAITEHVHYDTESGVEQPTTRLFVPSLYAMTAIFRLYQSRTVTQEVLALCGSNLSSASCHPRIAFQSACLLLSHHRKDTPESVWRRVMSATEEPSTVSDSWMDSDRDAEQWMARCHTLLKLVSSDEVIDQLIRQLAGVRRDKPEDAFPLMRRMIDLAFERWQMKQYVYDETTDGHSWTYGGGKRIYNKYLQPAGEGAEAHHDPDAVVDLDDIDPADRPVVILLSCQLSPQQQRVVLGVLSSPACWQISTNLYSFFRLPDQLKQWATLLTGTEWEERGETIVEERRKAGEADATQVKGMQVSYSAGASNGAEKDGDKAEGANEQEPNVQSEEEKGSDGADGRAKAEEEEHDHDDADGEDGDEDDEHAGCGGCGHGHQEEEALPDDRIPTKHADAVQALSVFSSSNPPLPSSVSSAHLLAAAFHRLRAVPWSKLGHAYGPASDIPFFLRLLCHPRYTERHAVLDTLYSNIYHQGSLYSATPFALPFMMDMLRICVSHTALQAWDRTQRLGCLSAHNDPLSPSCHSAAALVDVTMVLSYLSNVTQGYFGTHQVNAGYQKAVQAAICSQLDVLLSLLRHEDLGIVCQTMSLLGRLEQREEEVIAALTPFIDPSVPAPRQRPWDSSYEEEDGNGDPIAAGDKAVEINTPIHSPATSAMAAIHQLAARYPNNSQLLSVCRSNLQHPQCQPDTAFRSAQTLVMHDKEQADATSLYVIADAYGKLDALVKGGVDDDDGGGADVLSDLFAASAYLPRAQHRSSLLSSLSTTRSADFVLRIVQQLLSIDFKERWSWTDYSGAWTGAKMKLYGDYGLLVSDFMTRPNQKLATKQDKAEVWEKRQHPLTADELTAEQKEVVQAMVQCDVLWDKHVTNYWEKYGLPKERCDLRRLVFREETARLLPGLRASLTQVDATAEEKLTAMEVLVLLQPSHPNITALSSQVLHTPDRPAQLAYLASYLLLSAGHTDSSTSLPTLVEHVSNGLLHPDWLSCHDDLLLGLSPALRLSQLQQPSASSLSALLSALARCEDVQVACSVAYALLKAADLQQVYPFDKVEVRKDQQKNSQTVVLSFPCWSILPEHLSQRHNQRPQEPITLKEEDLTSELQRDVVSSLADADVLWSNNSSSLFRLFHLPATRAGMKQLLRQRNSERLIPAILPVFSTHNEQEAVNTMQQMVHLDSSHPQLVAVCEQVVCQQPPYDSASAHVCFLASYCLLRHHKEASDGVVVENVVSGVRDHSDWLDCFGDEVVGSSPLAALRLLSHSAAHNALVGLAEGVRAEHPTSHALVAALLSLSFAKPEGDWKEIRALPTQTADSLTSEQQRTLRAVLHCTTRIPQAGPRPLFSQDIYQCSQYLLPKSRQELQALLAGEGRGGGQARGGVAGDDGEVEGEVEGEEEQEEEEEDVDERHVDEESEQ